MVSEEDGGWSDGKSERASACGDERTWLGDVRACVSDRMLLDWSAMEVRERVWRVSGW